MTSSEDLPPVIVSFTESHGRGVDVSLGKDWPGFNEALADSASSMPFRGERRTTLSTYRIDLLTTRIEAWDGQVENSLAAGNTTELLKHHDVVIARSLYDLFDDEQLPVETILTTLRAWRDRVVERGGGFEIPET
jgi:hypothetical protein